MPISALVITVTDQEPQRTAALEKLARSPELELGTPHGLRVPAVMDTHSLADSRKLVERVQLHPGVFNVDVLAVNFEDCDL